MGRKIAAFTRPDSLSGRIGAAIEARRASVGLTRERLAVAAGVSANTITYAERGTVNLSVEILTRIADPLGCAGWELLREADVVDYSKISELDL